MKLSVVISAYNESKNIKDCLRSVSFADEIVVVDNSSLDGTGTIASSFGARVYKRPNNLMLNTNKNFGFSKAKGDWILNLDADERVTEDLQKEIKEKVESEIPLGISAFAIPRKNIIFGKWIEHTGWYPDNHIRMFRKGKAKFSEKHVHEQITVDGEIEKLNSPLLHESYKTIREFLMKFFVIYAPNEAENILQSDKYQFSASEFLKKPISEFTSRFYLQKGYKDGIHGLVLSLLMAFYHFVVVCYVWEQKKFVNTSKDSRDVLEPELKHASKDIRWWGLTSAIHETKSPFSKFKNRVQRKLLR